MTRFEMCDADELDAGKRIIREVAGREIAVFNVDGEYRAVANYCVHAGGPVCEGKLSGMVTAEPGAWEWQWEKDGRILACPWHGWEFDLDTGEFLSDPRYSLITFETVVEDGTVFVVAGGPAADPEGRAADGDSEDQPSGEP